MNGANWSALVRSRREQILACSEPEVFEKEVNRLVAELKTSHTGFRHAGTRNIPARHAINATLHRIPRTEPNAGCFRMCTKAAQLTWLGYGLEICCLDTVSEKFGLPKI